METRFTNIDQLVTNKYPNRNVASTDPIPIIINCNMNGPLNVAGGFIMCDKCGSIIRQSYLITHRSSGACGRNAEKFKFEENILKYEGPYVYMLQKDS